MCRVDPGIRGADVTNAAQDDTDLVTISSAADESCDRLADVALIQPAIVFRVGEASCAPC